MSIFMVRQNTQKYTDTGYINPSKTEYKIWTESQTKNIVKQQFTQQQSNLYANYYATKKPAAWVNLSTT